MFNTNFIFTPGKLSVLLDAQFGSSGKGKIGSYITEHADNWQFCCDTFMPQAGHWVKLDDGRNFFYQTFNSCAYNHKKFEKMYIGQGGCIELEAFFRELEENKIPHSKIGISPITSILQKIDSEFEKGCCDIDGNPIEYKGIAIKSGSTAHGCGANKARKILRRKNVLLARDVPELKEYVCDVPGEIMNRLDQGQAGFLEIAQGHALSLGLADIFPFCTSRNCTVAEALDDMMLPPKYAGNVILNLRTYPIRINSKKFVTPDGKHLTWEEAKSGKFEYHEEESYSGNWYPDQQETTWDEITKDSESETPIMEMTSVTKMPRRVATFSIKNVEEAIKHNDTGHKIFLSVNFINYVDKNMANLRGYANDDWYYGKTNGIYNKDKYRKAIDWLYDNIYVPFNENFTFPLFVGTGPKTNDILIVDDL
jgi:adenylosuccinate synthase